MTDVTAKDNDQPIDLPGVAVAVAYSSSADMFGAAQGILGLAYAVLDDAIELTGLSVPPTYGSNEVQSGARTRVTPYFTQLEQAGLAADKYAFYTRRSWMRHPASESPAADPLNNGYLILGGGEEATDLYTGAFRTALVLNDKWYSVNLKAVTVGDSGTVQVPPPTYNDLVPTNAIVDSGTNDLVLADNLFNGILANLSSQQSGMVRSKHAPNQDINLSDWPTLSFVLQGDGGDIILNVPPENYWQLDAPTAGMATCTLLPHPKVQSLLGLPLMNGYLTIFDNSANHGLGAIKFANIIH